MLITQLKASWYVNTIGQLLNVASVERATAGLDHVIKTLHWGTPNWAIADKLLLYYVEAKP